MKLYFTVLLSLVCVFCLFATSSDFLEYKNKADLNFKNENYEKAAKQYLEALDYGLKPMQLAEINNQIGKSYWNMRNYAVAKKYYQAALTIYQEKGNPKDIINLLNNLGTNYNDLGNYAKSLESYLQALAISRQTADEETIGFTLNNIGNVYLRWGNYNKAQEYYIKALKIRKTLKNNLDIAASYNNIALVYKHLNNLAKAIEYQKKSINICRNINNPEFCSYSLNNCGNIYLKWKKYDKALEFYKKSLDIRLKSDIKTDIAKSINNIGLVYFEKNNYALADENFKKSLEIRKTINDEQGVALSISQIAILHDKQGKYNKAIGLFKKALELTKKIGDKNGFIENKILLAKTYINLNNFKKAKKNLDIALKKSNEIGSVPRQIDCYETFWNMYEKLKKTALTLTYFKKYSELKEDLFSAKNAMKISDLQSMYEIEQKEYNIQILKSQKAMQLLQIKQQKAYSMLYLGLAIALVIITLLMYSFYSTKLKANKKLKNKNELIEKQNNDLEKINSELVYANKSKNKMFSIISHDLMNPFQIMIGTTELLCMNFQNYKQDELKEFIDDIHVSSIQTFNLLENLLTWTRNQTDGITFKPEKLEVKSVVSDTLDLLLNMANKKSIKLMDTVTEVMYVWADWNMLSTVIRNLCTNALKFTSKNGKVVIGAVAEKDYIKFTVKDTGVGIAKEMVDNLFKIEIGTGSRRGTSNEVGTGLGLILCKEFVEKNNGTIMVDSKIDEGSTFTFTIPVYKEKV